MLPRIATRTIIWKLWVGKTKLDYLTVLNFKFSKIEEISERFDWMRLNLPFCRKSLRRKSSNLWSIFNWLRLEIFVSDFSVYLLPNRLLQLSRRRKEVARISYTFHRPNWPSNRCNNLFSNTETVCRKVVGSYFSAEFNVKGGEIEVDLRLCWVDRERTRKTIGTCRLKTCVVAEYGFSTLSSP